MPSSNRPNRLQGTPKINLKNLACFSSSKTYRPLTTLATLFTANTPRKTTNKTPLSPKPPEKTRNPPAITHRKNHTVPSKKSSLSRFWFPERIVRCHLLPQPTDLFRPPDPRAGTKDSYRFTHSDRFLVCRSRGSVSGKRKRF